MERISGIFNVNKPRGITSHDVVAKIRGMLRRAECGKVKVGHAGTLDPLATGVLVICVGKATRIAEYAMQTRKLYRAGVRLGISTDTYDEEGEITQTRPVPALSAAKISAVLREFTGKIAQVPPVYSAIKRNGEALYKKARRGERVMVEPRAVEIYGIEPIEFDLEGEKFTIDVACSSGTYIRSLAHDVGERLGCGAHLYALTRLCSGHFSIEDAVTLSELQTSFAEGTWREVLLPMDVALRDFPRTILNAEELKRVKNGLAVTDLAVEREAWLLRAYAEMGQLAALLRYDEQNACWRPHKVFV